MTKMKGPREVSTAFVGGKEYAVRNGVVEVPDDAVAALVRHGFRKVEDDDAKRAELHLNRKG
jgi:hypothetical protein